MVSDSDYTEFDNFSKWLGVSQWNPAIFSHWTFFFRLYLKRVFGFWVYLNCKE
jgi:hypothetical protein